MPPYQQLKFPLVYQLVGRQLSFPAASIVVHVHRIKLPNNFLTNLKSDLTIAPLFETCTQDNFHHDAATTGITGTLRDS